MDDLRLFLLQPPDIIGGSLRAARAASPGDDITGMPVSRLSMLSGLSVHRLGRVADDVRKWAELLRATTV